MEYTQEITLDLNSNAAPPIIYTKQGDADTRVLEIHLMENGNEYQPPADAFAVFRMRKPDGTTIGAGVDDTTITSVNNNIVTVRLSEQALAAAGRGLADILLYNGDQYLSTASFILVIQPAPVAVMRGVVSSNEYSIFQDLLSSLGDTLPSVQSAAAEAVAASNSAQYWANNFSLTAGSPMQPGADPLVTGTAPAYTLRLPSIKPMATININETGTTAEATVTVTDFEGTAPAGLDPNLIKVFNFGITLPSGRNVQIDDTLTQSGQAADASAVGTALATKYDSNSSIPLANIGISSASPLSIENGGTGASNTESARANIGAQGAIQVYNSDLASGAEWAYDTAKAIYSQALYVPLNGINLDRVPEFVASPKDIGSWNEAADIGMGPPTAAAPTTTDATNWPLTFQAESSSTKNINITVYWW